MRIHAETVDPELIEAEIKQLESELRSCLARAPTDSDSDVLAEPTSDWSKEAIATTRALIAARRRLSAVHRRRNERPLKRIRSGVFTAHIVGAVVLIVLTFTARLRWDAALVCLVVQAVLCVLAWMAGKELVLRHAVAAAAMAATATVTVFAALGLLTSWVVVLTFPMWLAAFSAYLGLTVVTQGIQRVNPYG